MVDTKAIRACALAIVLGFTGMFTVSSLAQQPPTGTRSVGEISGFDVPPGIGCNVFATSNDGSSWRWSLWAQWRNPTSRVLKTARLEQQYFSLSAEIDAVVAFPNSYMRQGTYYCDTSAEGWDVSNNYWFQSGWGAPLEFPLSNSVCSCTPPQQNRAFTRSSAIGYFFEGPLPAGTDAAFTAATPYWNQELSAAASPVSIGPGGGIRVFQQDLPGDVMAQWSSPGDTIAIDPAFGGLTSEMKRSVVGHELGHALGVMGHSPCSSPSQSIMVSPLNSPASSTIVDADKCMVWSEYYNFS
jgi:hypothetical protein